MKKVLLTLALMISFSFYINAQSKKSDNRSCSVVCLDDHWIPKSYDVNAETNIDMDSKGIISVHEINDISDSTDYNKEDYITFKVAIYKKQFDTIISFSDESYIQLKAQMVLKKCEKGDQIIIILENAEKYSLPHHRIEVI